MISISKKISASFLLSAVALGGCATTAPHLLEPNIPLTEPAMDLQGSAFPTFTSESAKAANGQYELQHLPYAIPAPNGREFTLAPSKLSTYITNNGTTNALLYDDAREAMALAQVSKASKVTTTAQLSKASVQPIDKVLQSLVSKYTVERVHNSTGYNQHKFNDKNYPYLSHRYLVTSKAKAVTVGEIRDDLLSAMYGRKTKPQSGMETHVKNKVFYVDLATWSDLKAISAIHMSLWVHPVNFQAASIENKWIDDHERYITTDAFIHSQK